MAYWILLQQLSSPQVGGCRCDRRNAERIAQMNAQTAAE
jgi:hypothetical protein